MKIRVGENQTSSIENMRDENKKVKKGEIVQAVEAKIFLFLLLHLLFSHKGLS